MITQRKRPLLRSFHFKLVYTRMIFFLVHVQYMCYFLIQYILKKLNSILIIYLPSCTKTPPATHTSTRGVLRGYF